MNLVLGSFILPYTISGINSAAFHGLYIHYIVGLWLTPAGYVLIYYFLPAQRAQSDLRPQAFARRLLVARPVLSLRRHPSLSLQPDRRLGRDDRDRHLDAADHSGMDGAGELLRHHDRPLGHVRKEPAGEVPDHGRASCISSAASRARPRRLRSIQQPTHFTDFVISHSHLTVFGTFVVWAMGGLVYVWPRVCGRELWSFKMGNWSFWLITVGISTMGLVLTAGGLQQGFQWMAGAEWLDTVLAMRPYWFVRTVAGVSMDIGMSLLVINLMMTALARPAEGRAAAPALGAGAATCGRACRMSARFVALVAGVVVLLPRSHHAGRAAVFRAVGAGQQGDGGGAHRPRPAQMDAHRRHRLHAAAAAWPRHLSARRLLVLPFAVRAPGDRRDAALGAGQPESGEFAFDVPHLFGTRRIGPDLMRVGLKYSDEWHLAHFWNPRMLSPDSVMAALSRPVRRARAAGQDRRRWRRRSNAGEDAGNRSACSTSPARSRSSSRPTPTGCCSCRCGPRQVPADRDAEPGIRRRRGEDRCRDRGPRGARSPICRSSA